MLKTFRSKPVGELEYLEVVRLGGRVVQVLRVQTGSVTYRGLVFPVVYVSARPAHGPVGRFTVLSSETVIAAR